MGSKTKIDWCDATWNPVTGCYHDCRYCYARKIATRFGAHLTEWKCKNIHELDRPVRKKAMPGKIGAIVPYLHDFEPTFHRYRLNEPQEWKTPKNIFVCSMGDLMGRWVPDPWKQDVIAACKAAPQHRYLFLTKNPYGYDIWPTPDRPVEHEFDQDNFWAGCSLTGQEDLSRYDGNYGRYIDALEGNLFPGKAHRFISIEPILTDVMELPGYHEGHSALQEAIISKYAGHIEWIIIGAETGNRKGRITPKREWIDKIVDLCNRAGKPVFMKESLRDMMGNDFRQEFPWEVHTDESM